MEQTVVLDVGGRQGRRHGVLPRCARVPRANRKKAPVVSNWLSFTLPTPADPSPPPSPFPRRPLATGERAKARSHRLPLRASPPAVRDAARGANEGRSGTEDRVGARSRQDGASPPALDTPLATRSVDAAGREGASGGQSGGGRAFGVNAVAGAFAGTLVSVVLHPVDTVKVTIQADLAARKPLSEVIAKMLRKRGVFGLYDGLSASLASSAPISALYTASYELVKRRLEPMFPAEKAWVAHCLAGGCASVATSFVYTPSECVKQRCQVSHGAVTALGATRAIIAEGGVFGLYKGWTAVLCRNIPQSAIKFFVFEHLLRLASEAASRSAPTTLGAAASPLPTLAAGGLAGSTAALFTTPFDTIKTRLQTRDVVGGAAGAARGVLPTMRDIIAREGVGGLYRGVVPRLFIYVTQGAVFFTSYEMARRALMGHAARSEGAEGEAERDKRR